MINYVKVKRTLHVGGNPGIKYLARLFRGEDVSLDTIAKEISNSTTVSYPDVLAALKAFEIAVSKYVLNGQAVKLEYLGSFIPSIKAKAQETADKVTADTIKRTKCRFYPSVAFMEQIAKAQYQLKDLTVTGIQA